MFNESQIYAKTHKAMPSVLLQFNQSSNGPRPKRSLNPDTCLSQNDRNLITQVPRLQNCHS